jgi:hypothetical protein
MLSSGSKRKREKTIFICDDYPMSDYDIYEYTVCNGPDRFWEPPSLLRRGYLGLSPPGVKRSGREADHSPENNAEVKKTWVCTSTPPYAFMM